MRTKGPTPRPLPLETRSPRRSRSSPPYESVQPHHRTNSLRRTADSKQQIEGARAKIAALRLVRIAVALAGCSVVSICSSDPYRPLTAERRTLARRSLALPENGDRRLDRVSPYRRTDNGERWLDRVSPYRKTGSPAPFIARKCKRRVAFLPPAFAMIT